MSTPVSSGQHTPASTEAKHFLNVPGQGQYSQSPVPNRLKNVPGYSTPVFKGKEEQRAKVQANVAGKVCLCLSSLFEIAKRPSASLRDDAWT